MLRLHALIWFSLLLLRYVRLLVLILLFIMIIVLALVVTVSVDSVGIVDVIAIVGVDVLVWLLLLLLTCRYTCLPLCANTWLMFASSHGAGSRTDSARKHKHGQSVCQGT